jgi:hypothetical protein
MRCMTTIPNRPPAAAALLGRAARGRAARSPAPQAYRCVPRPPTLPATVSAPSSCAARTADLPRCAGGARGPPSCSPPRPTTTSGPRSGAAPTPSCGRATPSCWTWCRRVGRRRPAAPCSGRAARRGVAGRLTQLAPGPPRAAGALVVYQRPADYRERRSDGYQEPLELFVVGTAHLSAKSADDVARVVQVGRPNWEGAGRELLRRAGAAAGARCCRCRCRCSMQGGPSCPG